MSGIDLDDDRIEKLPKWAGELIYALDAKVQSAKYFQQMAEQATREAQDELHRHLTDTTGPADSDVFVERPEADNTDGEPTPALGLGKGAVVSFHHPALNRGDEEPSIQARVRRGRLVLTTDFGALAMTITDVMGRTAIAVTIANPE